MRTLAGLGNTVQFTHLSSTSCDALRLRWSSNLDDSKSKEAAVRVTTASVLDAMKEDGVPLASVCLLDPKAEEALTPQDGDGRFKWFLFGVSFSCLHRLT